MQLSAQSLFSNSLNNDTAKYVSGVRVVASDKRFFINASCSANPYYNIDSTLMIKFDIDGNII
ncbi:MAG: hypothetical protein LH473_10980 [Chitinophagales bacterium]|nr:hypothetical protein [Chitinophagales bacterium]